MTRKKKAQNNIGAVSWTDLTVESARKVRDFYAAVVGWTSSDVGMEGYSDFCMIRPTDGTTVAGICHARGVNAELPSQWLIYITVDDLKTSLAKCRRLGGKVIARPRPMGDGQMAVIRDPAGAVAALYAARERS